MISLTKQFVKEMEGRILRGELEVGARIPPLRVLAEEFHVSRSVINAGIVELCNSGYLETMPRKYVCVSDWKKTGNFAQLNGLIEHGLYEEDFFEDLLAGRMTIEKAIAGAAATARKEQDLEEIQSIIERERRCQDWKERAMADTEFHHALAVASHNVVYNAILNSFQALERQLIQEFYGKDIDHELVVEMHETLYEALKAQDAKEAEMIMERLLVHGETELKK